MINFDKIENLVGYLLLNEEGAVLGKYSLTRHLLLVVQLMSTYFRKWW